MTAQALNEIGKRVAETGSVTNEDVLAVRRAVYMGDAIVTQAEAEGVYAIERARHQPSQMWSSFFVEALSDYILNQAEPAGYVSAENAAWLEAQIKKRKDPSMDGDLEIVVRVIEQAREVPASFSAFALQLAKEAVLYGEGPDAQGRRHRTGAVDEADVAMLQRILWGAGSEGLLAVSREEAEALFAIADATTGADNVPAFDDLFAKAIGNYLIGATGRKVPDRETALRFENAGSYKSDAVTAMKAMLSKAPDFAGAFKARSLNHMVEDEHAHRNMVRDLDVELAAIMTPQKVQWLQDRINKNGVSNGPERALQAFIEREGIKLGAQFVPQTAA